MNTSTQGCIAENRFKVIALSLEIPIYEPVVDICGADFIIKQGDRFVKIQVKSTLTKASGRNSYKVTVQRGASNVKYPKNSFDVAALYIFELDLWYFIPLSAINACGVRVNPLKETCKWNQYKENYSYIVEGEQV